MLRSESPAVTARLRYRPPPAAPCWDLLITYPNTFHIGTTAPRLARVNVSGVRSRPPGSTRLVSARLTRPSLPSLSYPNMDYPGSGSPGPSFCWLDVSSTPWDMAYNISQRRKTLPFPPPALIPFARPGRSAPLVLFRASLCAASGLVPGHLQCGRGPRGCTSLPLRHGSWPTPFEADGISWLMARAVVLGPPHTREKAERLTCPRLRGKLRRSVARSAR